jgi:hypothetical protein
VAAFPSHADDLLSFLSIFFGYSVLLCILFCIEQQLRTNPSLAIEYRRINWDTRTHTCRAVRTEAVEKRAGGGGEPKGPNAGELCAGVEALDGFRIYDSSTGRRTVRRAPRGGEKVVVVSRRR